MIHVTSWNDGYETHDTKRKSGQLMWVRQNILMNDVRWAKLWMRKDAAQVWAGWTAIVWCAAHSADRGAIEGAEDVSILSRVPLEMVKLALEWGFSCGFIESRQNPDDSATEARQNPDEIPQTPEITATTGRDGTGQDDTGRDATGQDDTGHVADGPILPKGDNLVVWDLWKQFNGHGFGVKHLSWNPRWSAKVKNAKAQCRGYDFSDVIGYALEKAAAYKWFIERPDALYIENFLGDKFFPKLIAGYTPKDPA